MPTPFYNMTPSASPYSGGTPAPYELNRRPLSALEESLPHESFFAHGGSPRKKNGMTEVHLNSKEADFLDHWQGKQKRDSDGKRNYSPLENLLKNHHVVSSIHGHIRQHHAEGGPTDPSMEAEEGRFGDNEIARIGPNTRMLFDQWAGGKHINPATGHPEYWSLSNIFNGIKRFFQNPATRNAVRSAATGIGQHVLPAVLPAATQALTDRFGGVGQVAGDVLSQRAHSMLGTPPAQNNQIHEAIGTGLGRMMTGQASPTQAISQGLQKVGSGMGGGVGAAMQGVGQSMGQGSGLSSALRSGAQSGMDAMGGTQGLKDAAYNIAGGLGTGGMNGARDIAQQHMQDYMKRMMPQMTQPQLMG